MKISILIPTLNNQDTIVTLIEYLKKNDLKNHVHEIIVMDGGSIDSTFENARTAGVRVCLSRDKSKEALINLGAQLALADILYILHPRSLPPSTYSEDIVDAVNNGFQSGCFQVDFGYEHWFLNLKKWITSLDQDFINLEDQSLFVTREAFRHAGGFAEDLQVLKSIEALRRIKLYARFRIFDRTVKSCAKKYLSKGMVRITGGFVVIYLLYKFGVSQVRLQKVYRYLGGPDAIL